MCVILTLIFFLIFRATLPEYAVTKSESIGEVSKCTVPDTYMPRHVFIKSDINIEDVQDETPLMKVIKSISLDCVVDDKSDKR